MSDTASSVGYSNLLFYFFVYDERKVKSRGEILGYRVSADFHESKNYVQFAVCIYWRRMLSTDIVDETHCVATIIMVNKLGHTLFDTVVAWI